MVGKREVGIIGLRFVGIAVQNEAGLKVAIEEASRKHKLNLLEVFLLGVAMLRDV
jgi:hypothetical protein